MLQTIVPCASVRQVKLKVADFGDPDREKCESQDDVRDHAEEHLAAAVFLRALARPIGGGRA